MGSLVEFMDFKKHHCLLDIYSRFEDENLKMNNKP